MHTKAGGWGSGADPSRLVTQRLCGSPALCPSPCLRAAPQSVPFTGSLFPSTGLPVEVPASRADAMRPGLMPREDATPRPGCARGQSPRCRDPHAAQHSGERRPQHRAPEPGVTLKDHGPAPHRNLPTLDPETELQALAALKLSPRRRFFVCTRSVSDPGISLSLARAHTQQGGGKIKRKKRKPLRHFGITFSSFTRQLRLHHQRGEKHVLTNKDVLLTAHCSTHSPLSSADAHSQLGGLRRASEGLQSGHGSAEHRQLFTSL